MNGGRSFGKSRGRLTEGKRIGLLTQIGGQRFRGGTA